MAQYFLKYEFAHLANTMSAGYTATFPGLPETGTTSDGAKWHDLTEYITDPDGAKFTFGENKQQSQQLDSTGITRALSNTIKMFGLGKSYIQHWIIDHPNAYINSILIRVTDVSCNKPMGLWQINADSLNWCDGGECSLQFPIEEYSPQLNCLQQTLVIDNWRGWFPKDGKPSNHVDPVTGINNPEHVHPLYRYCDDIKPQFLQNFIFVLAQVIAMAFNSVVALFIQILDFIDWVITQIGGTFTGDDTFEAWVNEQIGNAYEALLGCGNKHPAPLIRNYYINACSKCGVEFESNIFNDPTSEYGIYYNACLLFAPVSKGLNENKVNNGLDYIYSNRWIDTPISLAYKLARLFNLKFKFENGVFSLHSKDKFPPTVVFDFSGDDAGLLLEPVCYGRSAVNRPASMSLKYGIDTIDMSGNEASHRYNGAVDWIDGMPEPDKWNFKGITEIISEDFAPARFATDGVEQKLGFKKLDDTDFWPNGILLMEKDAATLGKIIIWDGVSDYEAAEVIKIDVKDFPGVESEWPENDWARDNYSSLSYGDYYAFNYPMFFNKVQNNASTLTQNLFELYKIDDPTIAGRKNNTFTAKIERCCANLSALVYDAGAGDGIVAKIDHLVILPTGETAVIQKVEADYNKHEILISGEVKYVL